MTRSVARSCLVRGLRILGLLALVAAGVLWYVMQPLPGVESGARARRVKRAMVEATDLPVRSINAPRSIPGIDFSDQLNYWDAGYDALMITDTAFYRNPNYHRASDTPATLDLARMAAVVEGVHAALHALAED